MASINPNAHYVKFYRGSIVAWERLLLTPNRIDDDTLYFVYESEEHSDEGKLYLGQKLISGTETNQSGTINIDDIGDIYIDDVLLSDKQILVYNDTSQRWENTNLSTIISTAVGVMQGATDAAAGAAGLVPTPQRGDQNKFLRGDGAWATINLPVFDSDVFSTENNVITLNGIAQAQVGTIPMKTNAGIEWASVGAGTISRQIISRSDLQDLIENETANENTIYMVPLEDSVDSSDQYEEFLVVSGQLEKIGTIGDVDLTDYVTSSVFQSTVSDLNSILYGTTSGGVTTPGLISRVGFLEGKIGDLNSLILTGNNTTLVEEINTINGNIEDLEERLQWQEIDEEEEGD